MSANIAEIKSQAITVKSIAAESVVILQWLEAKRQHGLMANHLKEIGQGLALNLKHGVKQFLREINTHANIARKKNIYMLITLLNGQKMKIKGLMLIMELLYVLSVIVKFMADGLGVKDPKYCQVIIDRMRKLDPTLVIRKNGTEYSE